jgi:cbb3-type cytochrome oxidase subunit 3
MVNQEDGAMPGEGLTAIQTVTYFVIAPIALFVIIGGIAWAFSGEKKSAKKSESSSITTIE